jgi:hypothetical protein
MPTYIYACGIIALTTVPAWAQDVMLPKCASLHQARLEAVHLTASMSEAIEKRGPHVVCNLARKQGDMLNGTNCLIKREYSDS